MKMPFSRAAVAGAAPMLAPAGCWSPASPAAAEADVATQSTSPTEASSPSVED